MPTPESLRLREPGPTTRARSFWLHQSIGDQAGELRGAPGFREQRSLELLLLLLGQAACRCISTSIVADIA